MNADVEIRILGPVEVLVDGRRLALQRGKQPALLALLALRANTAVSSDQIVDALWSTRAPATAAKMVQIYISKLRRLFEDAGACARIVTRGSGYELRIGESAVDARRFERLIEEAARADASCAGDRARAALRLWRGPALADITDEPFAAAEIRALDELRMRALELTIDAELAAGRHGAVIGRLETLVAEHPLHERFHVQRMLALYRAGRQAEALDAFHTARRRLVDEIGIEPGTALRELHAAVLAQDPALDAPPSSDDAAPLRTAAETRAGDPRPRSASTELLERDRELALAETVLDRALAGGGALVSLRGVGGIGKTVLVEHLKSAARERGMDVLSARGSEVERQLGFGVVRQLLESRFMRAASEPDAALLAGAAQLARPVFEPATSDPAAVHEDLFPLLHGLYWMCVNLAARHPVLLVVDDAHCADPASLRFLAYLARRIADLPIALAVARRRAESAEGEPLLDALDGEPHATVLEPAPLSPDAVTTLVRARVAAGASETFCAACHEAAGGNPFYTRELLVAVQHGGLPVDDLGAHRVRELGPETIGRSVIVRLRQLGRDAVALARAIAVLGAGCEVRQAAAVAHVAPDLAADACDLMADAGVLAPGRPLAFAHPILRAAIYDQLTAGERSRQHARAARVLRDEHASIERVAAHLMMVEPAGDPQVVTVLREAASQARVAGGAEAAATYLARALAEPPPVGSRVPLLRELGSMETILQRPAAVERLREAFSLPQTPDELAQCGLALGEALAFGSGDMRGAYAVARETTVRLAAAGTRPSLELESFLCTAAVTSGEAAAVAESAESLAGTLAANSAAACSLLGNTALLKLMAAAPSAEVRSRVRRATPPDGVHVDDFEYLGRDTHVLTLMWLDELEQAEALFTAALDASRRMGALRNVAQISAHRAYTRRLRGDLAGAEADIDQVVAAGAELGFSFAQLIALLTHVLLLVDRGEPERAGALAHAAPVLPAHERFPVVAMLRHAQGLAEFEDGRIADAVRTLRRTGENLEAAGVRSPAIVPWRSALALALAGAGRDAEARRLAREELALATRADVARARGIALRTAGLLEGGEAGVRLLSEAVTVTEHSPARLEHARALIELGLALQRAGAHDTWRAPLTRGLAIADRCGAAGLAARARAALRDASQPAWPPATASLTATQLRVAELVAAGRSDREIAQALFETPAVVARHVAAILATLDTSRGELAAALGRAGGDELAAAVG